MRRIIWSPAARADLERIGDWLDSNRSVEFSAQTLAAIRVRADFLVAFPHGGRPLQDMRVLYVIGTAYVIVYRLGDTTTEVIRVHHEREDWLSAL